MKSYEVKKHSFKTGLLKGQMRLTGVKEGADCNSVRRPPGIKQCLRSQKLSQTDDFKLEEENMSLAKIESICILFLRMFSRFLWEKLYKGSRDTVA